MIRDAVIKKEKEQKCKIINNPVGGGGGERERICRRVKIQRKIMIRIYATEKITE